MTFQHQFRSPKPSCSCLFSLPVSGRSHHDLANPSPQTPFRIHTFDGYSVASLISWKSCSLTVPLLTKLHITDVYTSPETGQLQQMPVFVLPIR